MGTPQVTDDAGVRWIALGRPETLNALELGDLPVIASAISGLPDEIDAIALTSTTPGTFSSGMHKNTFNGATPQSAREIISTIGECLSTVRRAPVPTVAMIDGYCLGAALEMVLGCDFRVVTTRSTFGLPEVKLGIPSVIDAALLRHYVGLSLAKEIILTGDLYAVTELEPRRLFNRVVEPADMRSTTAQLIGRVTCLTREVVAAQKELFETWLNGGLQHGIEASIDVFANVFEASATLHAIARYQDRS